MDKLKNYDVSFIGLKNGVHRYDFNIDETFFDLFEFDEEFENPHFKISLSLEKKETLLDFNFKMKGNVKFYCDVTTKPFEYPLNHAFHMIVKFGNHYSDEGDDIVVVPHGEHTINIAQWIYENFMLSLPVKRVHPKVLNGEFKTEELHPLKENQIQNEKEIDPRWNKLKDLL